jgi:hypothetical protein
MGVSRSVDTLQRVGDGGGGGREEKSGGGGASMASSMTSSMGGVEGDLEAKCQRLADELERLREATVWESVTTEEGTVYFHNPRTGEASWSR